MKFDYFDIRGKMKWEGDEILLFWHKRESELCNMILPKK